MQDFVSRADLLSRAELQVLSRRSNARGLRQLGAHLGALGLSGWVLTQTLGSLWVAPALLLHATLLIFLFCPLHESIHRTAFRSRWLNATLAAAIGFLLLLPPRYFRCFHFAHHRYTQDPGRDPELAGSRPKPVTLGAYLWQMSGLGAYWLNEIRTRLRHVRGRVAEEFIAPSERSGVVREARAFFAGWLGVALVALWLGRPEPLYYWVVPVLLGRPLLSLFLLAEHTGCELSADMLRNTRTTRSNPLVRALTWNMPYHIEHHVFPGVPFHALPALHRRLAPHLGVVARGYLAFHRDLVRDLRARASGAAAGGVGR